MAWKLLRPRTGYAFVARRHHRVPTVPTPLTARPHGAPCHSVPGTRRPAGRPAGLGPQCAPVREPREGSGGFCPGRTGPPALPCAAITMTALSRPARTDPTRPCATWRKYQPAPAEGFEIAALFRSPACCCSRPNAHQARQPLSSNIGTNATAPHPFPPLDAVERSRILCCTSCRGGRAGPRAERRGHTSGSSSL